MCTTKAPYYDIIVEVWCRLCCKILRIEGLDGDKQIVDAVRLIAAHKHLTEVGILQHSPEGVQALLEDFFPVRYKEQTAGLARILLTEPLVIQGRNDSFAGASGCYNQIAVVTANFTFCLQFDDDGAGEVADIVTIKEVDGHIYFGFYHCKYSTEDTPGARVGDLYAVCGQAEKSIKWGSDTRAYLKTRRDCTISTKCSMSTHKWEKVCGHSFQNEKNRASSEKEMKLWGQQQAV